MFKLDRSIRMSNEHLRYLSVIFLSILLYLTVILFVNIFYSMITVRQSISIWDNAYYSRDIQQFLLCINLKYLNKIKFWICKEIQMRIIDNSFCNDRKNC